MQSVPVSAGSAAEGRRSAQIEDHEKRRGGGLAGRKYLFWFRKLDGLCNGWELQMEMDEAKTSPIVFSNDKAHVTLFADDHEFRTFTRVIGQILIIIIIGPIFVDWPIYNVSKLAY